MKIKMMEEGVSSMRTRLLIIASICLLFCVGQFFVLSNFLFLHGPATSHAMQMAAPTKGRTGLKLSSAPDLKIEKIAESGEIAHTCANITYNIYVTNIGTAATTGAIKVVDLLPFE